VPAAPDDEVTLTVMDGEALESSTDPAPWLELAAAKGFDSYVLDAERLDGDLFEVTIYYE
jgi:hypothetical protein